MLLSKVDDLRKDAEELVLKQSEMSWNNRTRGDSIDFASLYEQYKHLFTKENIKEVEKILSSENDPDQQNALELFRSYLLFEYIGKKQAKIVDEIINYQSEAKIKIGENEIPYRQAVVLLANEDDHLQRMKVYEACDPVFDKINPLLEKIEDINIHDARDLGFSNYIDMCSELKKCDYYALEATCKNFLDNTEGIYTELLLETLQKMDLAFDNFHRSDSWRLNRDISYDKHFSEENMLGTVKKSLAAMGFDLDQQENILIDSEKREKKHPRAACYNIVVPTDVRVTVKPTGGADDYRTLFHEMGHAEHFANTRQEVWEFKQLGDYTFSENFAFLFEHLMAEKGWVEAYTSMSLEETKVFLRAQAMKRLWYVRRYCGKLMYELILHSGEDHPEKEYVDILSQTLKLKAVPSDEKRHLDDVDEAFYVADYLRAWFLEAMLKERMREKFGEEWYFTKEAGEYIRTFMKHGQKLEPDHYAKMLGYGRINSEPLIREIYRMASGG